MLPELDDTNPEPRVGPDLLGQIETKFRALSAADMVLDLNRIGYRGFGWVRYVRKLLAHPDISYDQRDALWRDVVVFSRIDYRSALPLRAQWGTPSMTDWQTVALGLAMPGLRHAVIRRLGNPGPHERDDIHADLVQGFLTHLAKIDLQRRNVCGRLIGAGIRRARRGQQQRQAISQGLTDRMDQYGDTLHDKLVDAIGTREAFNRLPLHPTDRQLIQLTRLEGHTLASAAEQLGISLTAATSRRDRAEQRLATHFRPRRTTTIRHTPKPIEPDPPS